MSIRGTILGSGTGIPSLVRRAPGYLLEMDGKRWLVDCGSGSLLQLEQLKKSFQTLDGVFITHTHADHIGDLTPLVHAFRLPALVREKPFKLIGPPGFLAFFDQVVASVASPPSHFPFSVEEMSLSMRWDGVEIRSQATLHSDRLSSVAYRFEQDGKSIVFSGDCDYDRRLVEFAKGADVLILDCSTLDSNKVKGHLSAGLAGLVAAQAGVKRLIPTHFYPLELDDSYRISECRIHFSGSIDLAEDLMEFQI